MNMSMSNMPPGTVLSREMQMQITAAFERGEEHIIMREWLVQYPELSDDIMTFVLALQVVGGPEMDLVTAHDAAIQRGIARCMAHVAVAAAPALDLRAALKAAGVQKPQVARALHIGVDVLNKFVQGSIDLASVPQRFFAQLGQALNASLDEARAWAEQSVAGDYVAPSLRRGAAQTPDQAAHPAQQTFADALRAIANMAADERAAWLQGE